MQSRITMATDLWEMNPHLWQSSWTGIAEVGRTPLNMGGTISWAVSWAWWKGKGRRGSRETGKQGQGPELNRMEKQAEHEDSPAWLPTAGATWLFLLPWLPARKDCLLSNRELEHALPPLNCFSQAFLSQWRGKLTLRLPMCWAVTSFRLSRLSAPK